MRALRIASRVNELSWTWKSGHTSSGPRALAMQPWVSSTYMHDIVLCAAACWSHRINMIVHCSVRAEGAGPGQSTGFPCPRQYQECARSLTARTRVACSKYDLYLVLRTLYDEGERARSQNICHDLADDSHNSGFCQGVLFLLLRWSPKWPGNVQSEHGTTRSEFSPSADPIARVPRAVHSWTCVLCHNRSLLCVCVCVCVRHIDLHTFLFVMLYYCGCCR